MRILVTAGLAALTFIVGLAIGVVIGQDGAAQPDVCADALAAADAVASAIEEEWSTASAAVDAAQQALAESEYRTLAAACRSALAGD